VAHHGTDAEKTCVQISAHAGCQVAVMLALTAPQDVAWQAKAAPWVEARLAGSHFEAIKFGQLKTSRGLANLAEKTAVMSSSPCPHCKLGPPWREGCASNIRSRFERCKKRLTIQLRRRLAPVLLGDLSLGCDFQSASARSQ
jgi:hypothetical protein